MPTFNFNFVSRKNYANGKQLSTIVDVPASTGTLTATLDATTITVAGQSVAVGVEQSFDGGATWQPWAEIKYSGTPVPAPSKGDPTHPTMHVDWSTPTAWKARAYATVAGGPFTFGVAGSAVYA